jgi:hypothetical protein
MFMPRALRSWEVNPQLRRNPARESDERGRLLELRPGAPVDPYTTFNPELRHRQQLLEGEYLRQQHVSGLLQLVQETQLTVHARSIPGGFSRRVTAYAASSTAMYTEAFRRSHPQPAEDDYPGSSSESHDCKYPDPTRGEEPDDEDGAQADPHRCRRHVDSRRPTSRWQICLVGPQV